MVQILKLVSVLAFVLASFVTFSAVQAAPTDLGSIRGVVLDARGNAVAGADVSLHLPDRPGVFTVRSNDRGVFEFPRVRPGQYSITAAKRGVGTGAVRVAVRSGQSVTVRITLRQ